MSQSAKQPEFGQPLRGARPGEDPVDFLRLRRSTQAGCLQEPGPDGEILRAILTIASRAPDHRCVTPYRFIVFEGEARARFGAALRAAFLKDNPDATEDRAACEAGRFLRAPVVIGVVASPDRDHRTPEWEQILTIGAVCQNMLLAASAYGYAAQWITEWYAYDPEIAAALALAPHEKIAGFIYMGTAKDDPRERARPQLDELVHYY